MESVVTVGAVSLKAMMILNQFLFENSKVPLSLLRTSSTNIEPFTLLVIVIVSLYGRYYVNCPPISNDAYSLEGILPWEL